MHVRKCKECGGAIIDARARPGRNVDLYLIVYRFERNDVKSTFAVRNVRECVSLCAEIERSCSGSGVCAREVGQAHPAYTNMARRSERVEKK